LTGGHTIPAVNPLRRVFLGSGRLPEDLRTSLAAEGVVLLEEGLPGTITYINYRSPRHRSNWRKVAFTGAIAITGQRLVVAASRGGKPLDVPLADDRRKAVTVGEDGPGKLLLTIDPAAFDPRKSGVVEVRLRTPRAPEAVALLSR
jgi:hypothetical protein